MAASPPPPESTGAARDVARGLVRAFRSPGIPKLTAKGWTSIRGHFLRTTDIRMGARSDCAGYEAGCRPQGKMGLTSTPAALPSLLTTIQWPRQDLRVLAHRTGMIIWHPNRHGSWEKGPWTTGIGTSAVECPGVGARAAEPRGLGRCTVRMICRGRFERGGQFDEAHQPSFSSSDRMYRLAGHADRS